MKTLLLSLAVGILLAATIRLPGYSQQLLCERILTRPGLAPYLPTISQAPNGDFVVLAQAGTSTTPGVNAAGTYLYLARLSSPCDTLWQRWIPFVGDEQLNAGLAADAQNIWVLTGDTVYNSITQQGGARTGVRVWQFTAGGLLHRSLHPALHSLVEVPIAMLPDPNGGCYASVFGQIRENHPPYNFSVPSLLRYDSTGALLWRHDYTPIISSYLNVLSHTARGTVLLAGYAPHTPSFDYHIKIIEAEPSRGDSIGGAFLPPPSSAVTEDMEASTQTPYDLVPLVHGRGFVLTSSVTANSGTPLLVTSDVVRLDANYNVLWRYTYPNNPPGTTDPQLFQFTQVRELADGSLLALGRTSALVNGTFYLYRFDASTGTVLATYPVRPQLSTQVAVNYLLPAADSTLFIAGSANTAAGLPAGIYVAQVRIPGLPRIVTGTAPAKPAAALGTRVMAYPNPANEQVTVSYSLPSGVASAQLVLRDPLGRLVYQTALSTDRASGELTFPVDQFAPCLYLLTLVVDGQTIAAQRTAIQR